MNNEHEDKPIVFAFYKDNKLKGYKSDTFNTITDKWPKIYTFSRSQVDIVVEGVKQGCNKVGTSFAKVLAGHNLIDNEGNPVDGDQLIKHMSKTEKLFQEWNEFELHVLPFIPREEWYELGEGDEWKKDKILSNPKPAIETHKFKIMVNSN